MLWSGTSRVSDQRLCEQVIYVGSVRVAQRLGRAAPNPLRALCHAHPACRQQDVRPDPAAEQLRAAPSNRLLNGMMLFKEPRDFLRPVGLCAGGACLQGNGPTSLVLPSPGLDCSPTPRAQVPRRGVCVGEYGG